MPGTAFQRLKIIITRLLCGQGGLSDNDLPWSARGLTLTNKPVLDCVQSDKKDKGSMDIEIDNGVSCQFLSMKTAVAKYKINAKVFPGPHHTAHPSLVGCTCNFHQMVLFDSDTGWFGQ
jgi:hypothetical protein